MLTSDNILESLINHMKVADIFGCLRFRWNGKYSCFEMKSKLKQQIQTVRFFISALYASLVFLQVVWTWKDTSVYVKLHSVFHICALLVFSYTHHVFRLKSELIVSYLNGTLMFENRTKGKYLRLSIFVNLLLTMSRVDHFCFYF